MIGKVDDDEAGIECFESRCDHQHKLALSEYFRAGVTALFIEASAQEELRSGKGINKVARELGVGTGTVQRVAQEMDRPFVGVAA